VLNVKLKTIMKKLTTLCLLITAILFASPKIHAQISIGISISANIAPPEIPVYVQPECPTDGYLWVPGYWAYDDNNGGYYWVPGVWVAPPTPGYLWTPAYWGYDGGVYGFHAGYWGTHVGFYGGINYGGGYGGYGFGGGRWEGGSFRYNTAVVNVNRTVIHNTYIDRTVIINNNTHTSFNGPGGVTAKPRPDELAAMKEHHVQATSAQVKHMQTAHNDKTQYASVNHGKPSTVAMNKVGGSHFSPQGKKVTPMKKPAGNAAKPANAGHNASMMNKKAPSGAAAHKATHNNNAPAKDNATKPQAAAHKQAPQQHKQAQPHRAPAHAAKPQHAQARPAEKHE